MLEIKKITDKSGIEQSKDIIKRSFADIAEKFALTIVSCPSNPAFITIEKLSALKDKRTLFFGLFEDSIQKGFVGIEPAKEKNIYYLEKLAVIPEAGHKGCGKLLVDFVFEYVKN